MNTTQTKGQQQLMNSFQLPSIRQMLDGDVASGSSRHIPSYQKHVTESNTMLSCYGMMSKKGAETAAPTNSYYSTSYSTPTIKDVASFRVVSPPSPGLSPQYQSVAMHATQHVNYQTFKYSNVDLEIRKLESQIIKMESLVKKQAKIIEELENEKKRKIEENNHNSKKRKQTKQSPTNTFIFKTCSVFNPNEETSSHPSEEEDETSALLANLDDHTVIWQNETFVLIDAFKNRNKILNFFIPLYQSQFPDKKCKIVLSSDEYRQLFKENSHRTQSERKHAWRISIFTLDFYHFVKNQM